MHETFRGDSPLRSLRLKRGLTQKEICLAVGIDQAHYSRIETGQAVATADVAKRLAEYFGHAVTEMQILYPERYTTETLEK